MSDAAELDPWKLTSYLPREATSVEVGLLPLNSETFIGLLGLGWIMLYTLGYVQRQNLASRNTPVLKSLLVAGIFSLGFTMATQWVGHTTYDYLRPNGEQTEPAQAQKSPPSKQHTRAHRGNVFLFMALVAVLIVGGGYAFTAMHDLNLFLHMLGFTFGVGLTAEFGKLIAASLLLSPILALTKSRRSLLPFILTGLGFGIGEALFYFRDYAGTETAWLAYWLRGTWSVLLHISWCTISAYVILKYNDHVPEPAALINIFQEVFWGMVIAMLPAAILHGVHDALLAHDEVGYAVLFGLLSMGLGWEAARRFKKLPRPKPEPVTA
jgi:hypothetical protein